VLLTARPSTPNSQSALITQTQAGFVDTVSTEIETGQNAVWASAVSDDVNRDAVGDARGFSFSNTGFSGGVSRTSDSGVSVGLAVGMSSGDVELDENSGKTEAESLFGAAYVGFRTDSGTFVGGGVSMSTQSFDASRNVTLNGVGDTLTGETDGSSFGAFATLGKEFEFGDWTMTASGRIAYVSAKTDAYEEQGTSILRLSFDEVEAQALALRARVMAERSDRIGGDMGLSFRVGGGLAHESALDDRVINATFVETDSAITMQGDDTGRTMAEVLGGVGLTLNENLELRGDAAFQTGGGQDRSNFMIGARFKF
jgi:uncharacterized protein with beta-barrel porin domain